LQSFKTEKTGGAAGWDYIEVFPSPVACILRNISVIFTTSEFAAVSLVISGLDAFLRPFWSGTSTPALVVAQGKSVAHYEGNKYVDPKKVKAVRIYFRTNEATEQVIVHGDIETITPPKKGWW